MSSKTRGKGSKQKSRVYYVETSEGASGRYSVEVSSDKLVISWPTGKKTTTLLTEDALIVDGHSVPIEIAFDIPLAMALFHQYNGNLMEAIRVYQQVPTLEMFHRNTKE